MIVAFSGVTASVALAPWPVVRVKAARPVRKISPPGIGTICRIWFSWFETIVPVIESEAWMGLEKLKLEKAPGWEAQKVERNVAEPASYRRCWKKLTQPGLLPAAKGLLFVAGGTFVKSGNMFESLKPGEFVCPINPYELPA